MSVYFISNDRIDTIQTYKNLNLLAHAQIEELDIGSRCGGHGICGGDKIKVSCSRTALSPPTEAEKLHLTEIEIKDGWRLGCQCWPSSDQVEIKAYYVK